MTAPARSPITGPIYALDLAQRTGFACGLPGTVPRSGTVILRGRGETADAAHGNLIDWLSKELQRERPELVVKEAPFSLQAFADRTNSQAGVEMSYGLHAIATGVCHRFGIPCVNVYAATVRKHFLGRGRMGSRPETKRAVVNRARLLGLMPKDCDDNDRADAIANWDWACATYTQRSASLENFHLFGETAGGAHAGA